MFATILEKIIDFELRKYSRSAIGGNEFIVTDFIYNKMNTATAYEYSTIAWC